LPHTYSFASINLRRNTFLISGFFRLLVTKSTKATDWPVSTFNRYLTLRAGQQYLELHTMQLQVWNKVISHSTHGKITCLARTTLILEWSIQVFGK